MTPPPAPLPPLHQPGGGEGKRNQSIRARWSSYVSILQRIPSPLPCRRLRGTGAPWAARGWGDLSPQSPHHAVTHLCDLRHAQERGNAEVDTATNGERDEEKGELGQALAVVAVQASQ